MIFSLARSRSAAFFDSHSFVLGRYISGRIRKSRIFFLRGCFFLVFARDNEPPINSVSLEFSR